MLRRSHSIPCALVFALAMLGAPTALAAQAPSRWQRVDLTVQAADSLMLLSATLPDSAKLPAMAKLSVPKGARLVWAGEILGGDLSKDPALSITTSTVDGVDVYNFTLTKSRTAQIEAFLNGTVVLEGDESTTDIDWVPTGDVGEVRLYVRLPAEAEIVRAASGAELLSSPTGDKYYGKTFKDAKAGRSLGLSFSFSKPGAVPASPTGGSPGGSQALLIVVGVVGAGFALLALSIRRRKSAVAEGEDEEAPPTPAHRNNRLIVALVVVGLVAAIALAGVGGTDTPQVVDGKITRFFGSADSCTSASFALEPGAGVDLAKSGQEVISVFEKFQGVGDVTIHLDGPRMDVAFCESSTNEQAIVEALNATGLVTATSAGAAAPQ